MHDAQNHQQQDQLAVENLEFRLAMDELLVQLQRTNEIMFKWRHACAEHLALTNEAQINVAELRLKHWLDHHSDEPVIHSPAQFLEEIRRRMEGN